jgi:phosphatidylserine decarboxylase
MMLTLSFVLARRLLKSLSIKQGIKYDDPESAKDIPTFIEFHQLKEDEILDPLDSFSTFQALLMFAFYG